MHDYSVALGMVALAFAALMIKADETKCIQYIEIAMEICKNVAEPNSDVYSRCLHLMTCFPSLR